MSDRWATFDCYGTLVDWLGGMRASLARLWPDADTDALLTLYHQLEPAVQSGRGITYREVMAETLARLAQVAALTVPPGEEDALGSSLPGWPVFPEVRASLSALRRLGWRLAILSNTDPDLLDASLREIGVPVDLRVVASEVGSYKPALRHWESFFAQTGADRLRHAHVAASLFHDVEPTALLGLRCVWINRLGERSGLPRSAELLNLADLPDALEALVPA
ncbi:MAG: HAD family hydrolase [Chloroflexota bacterium]|nr:HAD family hydrolase [Chloroflexota bacterium]